MEIPEKFYLSYHKFWASFSHLNFLIQASTIVTPFLKYRMKTIHSWTLFVARLLTLCDNIWYIIA